MGRQVKQDSKEKPKRRNSELRKLKSRNAARSRRGKESGIFNDLAKVLPPEVNASNPDKSSIIRLAISCLKLDRLTNLEAFKDLPSLEDDREAEVTLTPDLMDGFLLVLSFEGDMVFISKDSQDYLGLSQMEMMGHSVYDYTHPCDHEEIKEMLAVKSNEESRSAFLRFKCTLSRKGRPLNLKSATYKVIHCQGKLFSNKKNESMRGPYFLIANCHPIPHPSNLDAPLCPSSVFFSKHSLDMKYTYTDKDVKKFLGYETCDLIGQSMYNYLYALDGREVERSYKILFSKGQVETKPYRFLLKSGGWIWLSSQATVLYSNNNKPEEVIQINYVLSSAENEDAVVSCEQVKQEEGVERSSGPQLSTKSTFAPLTDEMNKGFLVFADDDPSRTLLKDEPDIEDLTNLAPSSGGDTCVPLDVPTFEVFEDFLFPDGNSFLSYRDDCNSSQADSTSSRGDLSSLSSLDKYGNPSPIESLGSVLTPPSNSPDPDISEGSPSGKLSLAMDMCSPAESPLDSEEYSSRAPYIPMGVSDDLPLLADDLMWSATSPSSVSSVKSSDSDPSSTSPSSKTSSLAQLLKTQQSSPQSALLDTGQKQSSVILICSTDGGDKTKNSDSQSPRHSTAYHLKRTLPVPEPLGQVRSTGTMSKETSTTPITKRIRTNELVNGVSGGKVIIQTVNSANKVSVATTATQTSPMDTINAPAKKVAPITFNLCTMQNGQQVIGIIQANRLLSPQKQIQALREQQQQLLEQQEEQRRKEWEAKARASVAPEMRDSVLLNLLISGQDTSAGYSCPGKTGKMKSPGVGAPVFGSLLGNTPSSGFSEITQQDCDVNAPVSQLLQGADLLQALDSI